MPGFPQTSSEAPGAERETMPQPSSKGMTNPWHVMCPHRIHQRTACKGLDTIYTPPDLTWNHLNLCRGTNPPFCHLATETVRAHMSYLIPTPLCFSAALNHYRLFQSLLCKASFFAMPATCKSVLFVKARAAEENGKGIQGLSSGGLTETSRITVNVNKNSLHTFIVFFFKGGITVA